MVSKDTPGRIRVVLSPRLLEKEFPSPLRVCSVDSVMSNSLRPRGQTYSPPGSSVHGISLARYTGVGCHFLLQEIFPTQGSNLGLLHCRWILY